MKKIKKREKMKKELAAKKGKPSNIGGETKPSGSVSKPKNKSKYFVKVCLRRCQKF